MNYKEYLENARSVQLSRNFMLYEVCHSVLALAQNIQNIPSNQQIANAQALITNVLQPLRDHYKSPIDVSSFFRNKDLNKVVNKGKDKPSQHMNGEAVDFVVRGRSLKEVVEYIRNNLQFDQLILEPTWIHISFSKKNRKQVLRFDGKTYSNY